MLGGEEQYTRDLLNDADWGWNEGGSDHAPNCWPPMQQQPHQQPRQQPHQQWQPQPPPLPLQPLQTHQQQLAQPPPQLLQPCLVQPTSMDWQLAMNGSPLQPLSAQNPAKRPRLA